MKRKMWAAALAASMVMSAFSGMTVSAAEADSDLSGTLTILSWYDETKAAPVLEAFKEKYPNVNVDFQYYRQFRIMLRSFQLYYIQGQVRISFIWLLRTEKT